MADEDNTQKTSQTSDAQLSLAPVENNGMLPAVDPAAITREASNIARELRTLAHRVEGFKINFGR